MDQQTFLRTLGAKLKALGAEDSDINKHLGLFDKYLNSLSPEELSSMIGDIDNIDTVAINIFNLIQRKKQSVQANSYSQLPQRSPDAQTVRQLPTAARTPVPPQIPGQAPAQMQGPAPTQMQGPAPAYAGGTPLNQLGREEDAALLNGLDDAATKNIDAVHPQNAPQQGEAPYYGGGPAAPPQGGGAQSYESYDDYDDDPPGSPVFWLIFILTLPITVPLFFALIMVFVAVFAAISVLIAALVLTLIAVAAVGTVLSLVGIIYGITQTISSLPVGLYEIGLGVLIGGTAMFTGILVYNAAVRLLPFIMKKTAGLLAMTVGALRDLFRHLKRESAAK